jgi:glycosyltransferase involved in cell wall biosynthesis
LFVGRLETKKNVQGLIKAFNLLKRKYQVPHKLVLVGPRGYGYEDSIGHLLDKSDIIEKGYLLEQEKWSLLKNADLFVFPSFYEGFGMPILEAQAVGCPVVATNVSSIPEVAGKGAMLVEPKNIEQIAEVMYKIISDDQLKKDLIARGYQNVERFSWQKCAEETLRVLTDL